MLMPVKLDGKQHMAPNNGMILAEYWEEYQLQFQEARHTLSETSLCQSFECLYDEQD